MVKHNIPPHWGLCFAGNEEPFCSALQTAVDSTVHPFLYVEIGLGYGQTLNSVCQYLFQTGIAFKCHGVDLPVFSGNAAQPSAYPKPVTLHLVGAKQYFADAAKSGTLANFVFIDGCHGCACVTEDFIGAEKIIAPGGVVAFHDTDPGCQDIHPQPHCGTGIRAREAVDKLGLLDDSRPGWRKLFETSGNKDKGGHGCLFVQRIQN